jgi:predicted TIM-barrel fold metal-dependent hydrolase
MIIDFHAHVFPDRIAEATVKALGANCNIPSYSDGTVKGLIEKIDKAGVDIAINLPALTKPSQFESVLAFSKALNEAKYSKGRIISFAGMHPDCEDIDGKLALVKEQGFKGIKIHPDYQHTFFDDERYVKIISSAKKYGLIVTTHAGLDGAFIGQPIKCTPERVLRLLDKVGGYDKLVLAHLGGNTLFEEVYEKLAGEDVYLDTAYILDIIEPETFMKILDKHGSDRILFATDSPWQDIEGDVKRLRALGLDKETEDMIFSKNAVKLLEI